MNDGHDYLRYRRGCRCPRCRADNAAYGRAMKLRRRAFGMEPPVHGENGYQNYGCRCDECRATKIASVRDYERRTGRPMGE